MLIFASGRTDIPAFYSQWFINRVRAGFVDVRNPYYAHQVSRYKLSPDLVDFFVFCTKNPKPMILHLEELKNFGIYFFVTITPYEKEVEGNVPDKQQVIESFIELSKILGRERVCWRYDPIFIDQKYSVSFHIREFRKMAEQLCSFTDRCIISFIDLYEKTKKKFPNAKEVSEQDQKFIAQAFARIGTETGIQIESCAEQLDLTAFGVKNGGCISRKVIERAAQIHLKKNIPINHLRKFCSCLPTHDIGSYNSCPHLCKYCYANYDESLVKKNFAHHNPNSTFLIGESQAGDIVKDAPQISWRDSQLLLF